MLSASMSWFQIFQIIFYIYVKNAKDDREKCRDSKDAYARLLKFSYCQERDVKYAEIICYSEFLELTAVFDDKI